MEEFDPEIEDLMRRYFSAVNQNSVEYFDEEDYVAIIEYFIDHQMMKYAQNALKEAESVYPNHELILDKKAELLLNKKDIKKAIEVLLSIQDPEDTMTFGMLGECYLQMKQTKKADEAFNKMIEHCYPEELHDMMIDAANMLNQYGEYGLALDYSERGLAIFPDDMGLLNEKAFALSRLGRIGEAKIIYNSLIDKDPYLIEPWHAMASIYCEEDNFSEAVKCYDYILAIKEDVHAAKMKGACLMQQGETERAIEPLLLSLKLDPKDYFIKLTLAQAYTLNDELDKARPLFKDIVDNYPIYPTAFRGYATCLLDLDGDTDKALKVLRQAAKLFPNDVETLFLLSHIEIETNILQGDEKKFKVCIKRLQKCLAEYPDHPLYNNAIALAYLMSNQFEKAYRHFMVALNNGYNLDNIYIYLATAAWMMDDKELFEKHYLESKSRYANTDEIVEKLIPGGLEYLQSKNK